MSALSLRSLTKAFDEGAVIRNIDLEVAAGECVAVLGPSGAGKSTILRLIAGLETASSGTVALGGHNVDGVPAERRGVALMFQRPLLFPHLNALDNVAFSARSSGRSKRSSRLHAQSYLELVQLGDFAYRRATELSGGQAQRVALARALAAEPRVLLLDEPFSALDPQLRGEMHGLLRQIRSELSPTILLVTHDQHEAAVLADRMAILLNGTIAQIDTPHHIYTRPRSLPVHRMMGGINEIFGDVRDGKHHSEAGVLTVSHSSGVGTLVFRHEAVGVTEASEPGDLAGIVAAMEVIGARQRLHIDINAGHVTVCAEAPPTLHLPPGSRVSLHIPQAARHVILEGAPFGNEQTPPLSSRPESH